MTAATGLTLDRVSFAAGRRQILREISLPALTSGTITAVAGPNGAGKSTLLRAIAGLAESTGEIVLDQVPLTGLSPVLRARRVGLMPQEPVRGAGLTVLECLIAIQDADPDFRAQGRTANIARALACLDSLDLTGLGSERIELLSGGQAQLVSLAMTLIKRPRVVLLDEPTSALDLRHREIVMGLARRYADDGHVVAAVFHDLDLAARWSDRIVLLEAGRLHADGTPAQVLTARTLAEVYQVRATVRTGDDGRPRVTVDGALDPRPAGQDGVR